MGLAACAETIKPYSRLKKEANTMACSWPQGIFNANLNLGVSLNVSGTTATLWLENQGFNVLQLTRILLGVTYPGGSASVLFLRPPGQPISWSYPSATLEQGIGATFYTLTGLPPGAMVEAQAEYTEVQDRSRSCQATV
jgi:hypothetical protein